MIIVVLAADLIRGPAPEDPAGAVGQRAERGGQRQRAGREAPRLRHRSGVGGDQQAAGRHQHEHRVHHVELRRAQHLERGEVLACRVASRRRRPALAAPSALRPADAAGTARRATITRPWNDAGRDERRLIAARRDRRGDDRDEERRAAAEARGHDARRQAAPVLEPFQRRTDRSAVDERRADAGHAVQRVQHRQRRGVAHARPAQAAQQSGGADEPARAEPVDEPAVERLDPGLKQDEQREGGLDVRELPAGARLQRLDEQRPGILQVGDHDHRDQRRDELEPAIVQPHDPPPSNRIHDRTSASVQADRWAPDSRADERVV